MVSLTTLPFDRRMRDRLMPMHMRVSETGHITDAGPTLRKLRAGDEILGHRVLEVFQLLRPSKEVQSVPDLASLGDTQVELRFRDAPQTRLKGVMMVLPDEGGLFFNLSFGISAIAAIEDYDLTNSDFAPTDMTIELLYLKEANNAVTSALYRQGAELEESRALARSQAQTDPLTGLGNRRSLGHALDGLIGVGAVFTFMQLDLDGFKLINDRFGHSVGDEVLEVVAQRLRTAARQTDMAFRIGGDEFVLLLPELQDHTEIMELGRRVIAKLEEPISTRLGLCDVSGTIGYARSQDFPVPTADHLAKNADEALYRGKRSGKGTVVAYQPANPVRRPAQAPPD